MAFFFGGGGDQYSMNTVVISIFGVIVENVKASVVTPYSSAWPPYINFGIVSYLCRYYVKLFTKS